MIWVQMFGMEIRTAFSSLLYRKALKLSPIAAADTNLGNIVTLITRDVQAFVSVIFSINDTWVAMSQVIVICYLLFNKVGYTSFVGIGILLSALPIQIYIGKWIMRYRLKTSKKTDERLQLSQEIISTIRIIKMFTWEEFFTSKLNAARQKEMKKHIIAFYLKRVLVLLGIFFSNFGFYMLIVACIWTGVTTETSIIFYVLANFRDLKHSLAFVVPIGMGEASGFLSSYKRITKALEAEELITEYKEAIFVDKPSVELDNATVQIQDHLILKNVSFKITHGLTVITGAVGSGKSSVLKTILKDFPLQSGSVETRGKISYACQDPWLFPSSIKQNILFGEPFKVKRYQEVVKVCALTFDFNLFENGDETVLTDRGLNLSKGQQARINLARAVYNDADIYLLDDCLTALDTTVQEYIFQECIKKYLRNKVCIFVTQSERHIKEADLVLIMDKGIIKDKGVPTDYIAKEVDELTKAHDYIENDIIVEEPEEPTTEQTYLLEKEQAPKTKIYSEVKKQGTVDWKVYKKYFDHGGGILLFLFIIAMSGSTQFSTSSSERLLTKWVDKKQVVLNMENNMITNVMNTSVDILSNLAAAKELEENTFKLYSIFMIISSALEFVNAYLVIDFCRRASVNIHKVMVDKLIYSVMIFFDTHLIGNILNRLSQDMLNTDEHLSVVIMTCVRTTFIVGGILSILILINPYCSIIIIIVIISSILLRIFYLPAGRSLKRLEASTRSPMIGHLNATLEGLTTVRASKIQEILIDEYNRHLDLYTSTNFISTLSARAFGFCIDLICSAILIFIIVKCLFFPSNNTPGDIGLSITQVSSLSISMTWLMRQLSELENYMTSLERIIEYTDIKTEQKEGAIIKNWPLGGSICYQNVSLSYKNNDDIILKNLNFDIKSGEKIGIVGRTGAGKSSIISTIFRLYDIKGKILIDGVDIKSLSLDFLRKNIVAIPQDPIIFSGSIRTNLDPLGQFEDIDMWNTLDKVGMKAEIRDLDECISSANLNFSSGQKQLLCLGRAILRKNKIVVMDEATANMDHESDKILQKIIQENFSDCTILTIAHRLHSVLGCDRVMVLDRGIIKEFDNPLKLLKNPDGIFYKIVKQSGIYNTISLSDLVRKSSTE